MINFSIKELAHAVHLLDSSLVRIFVEMKGLTCQQLAEESGKEEDFTLHSDGTSKYGHCQHSFQQSLIGKK